MTDLPAQSPTMAAAEALHEFMRNADHDPEMIPPWHHLSEEARRRCVAAVEEVMRAHILSGTPAGTPPHLVRYVNYKGREADRSFIPDKPFFGSTEHHPVPQWLIPGVDAETGKYREFAMDDMCGRNLVERLGPTDITSEDQA